MLIHLHDGRLIAAAVAVIGRREDGHDVHLVTPIVAVHDQLMGPADQIEAVLVIPLLRNVLAEGESGPAGADAPAAPFVRIAPEEVAHGSLVGHLLHSIQLPHVIERIDGRAEAAVEAKDAVLHERRQGEVVEEIREHLPHVGRAVLPNALVVEAVHLRDLAGFVIAPEDKDSIGIADLEADQHGDGFDGVISPIDVIPHEEVVGIGRRSADAVQLHEIVPLAVNVAAHRDGRGDRLDVGFVGEMFPRLVAQLTHLRFAQRSADGQFGEPPLQVGVVLLVRGERISAEEGLVLVLVLGLGLGGRR
mmetsp:Transcript_19392/g.56728  ORF Transcript_19392/g.56728 Transcript_19392/m.56728 type:complete len:305 (+) Transcript_19392:329-1243(+)